MGRPRAGLPGPVDIEAVRGWVEASCAAQDLPVLVDDAGVLGAVAGLLGARGPQGAARPAGPPRSHSPDDAEPGRVEAVVPPASSADGDVVDDGSDDGLLAA